MKKIVFAALATVLAVSLFAQTEEIEKKGFLTTKWCVKNDLFKDCRLESAVCVGLKVVSKSGILVIP